MNDNTENDHEQSVKLMRRWQDGDEAAAGEIFDRYVNRLLALASSRISAGMHRRIEAEDVVQSVYRSFFRDADPQRFTIERSGQLWGLLAAITINKIRSHVRFHTAGKRDVNAEKSTTTSQSCYGLPPMDVADEPTADEAAALVEEMKIIGDGLTEMQRDVFELFLQNQSVDEIAAAIRRSPRTVRRIIEELRTTLEKKLL